MKKTLLIAVLVGFSLVVAEIARAAPNEVWLSGDRYHWKIDNVQQGSSTDLATAINRCVWESTGAGREIHLLTGGELSATIGIPPDVSLHGHGNTFTVTHGGYSIHAKGVDNIGFYDMTITGSTNMVFRITACDNVVLSGIHIDGGFIGMRVDSRESRPWEATSYHLTVVDCTFENLASHGLETYGVDGVYVDEIVARNNGESGVLFNNSRNGFVGTIDAYRCSYGGGYAGLRFANGNENFRVQYLRAIECGRGFFTTTDARNIVVEEVYIRDCTSHAILIQHSDEVGVNSGTHDGFVINHYTSVNSWILATDATGATEPPPAAPADLTATVGSDSIALTWSPVQDATSYRLQRATSGDGPFFTIAYSETTGYADRDIAADTRYYYRVRAVNAAGPGDPSAEVPAVVSGPVTPVVDLDLGLQLHYRFDGSTSNSQGGPPATITGSETYETGFLDQSLALDGGTNYATLQPLAGNDYREFTIATWIRPETSDDWQRIFDFGSDTSDYMMMTLVFDGLRFDIGEGGTLQTIVTTEPAMERWSHVALTFIGNWATLYINGIPQSSVLFSHSPTHLDLTQNFLGKGQFANDPLFQGRIDDFRLYTRGLSSEEVAELVQSAPPLPPFDLRAGAFGTRVDLYWSGVENAASYNVKRATTSGGPYTTIATGLTGTTYSDTSVTHGLTYHYVITASNAQGESAPSDEAPAAVSDLVAHLTFDETEGDIAADSSGNTWDATLQNGATRKPGMMRNALRLSASESQHATLPQGVVSGLDDFTISTWIRVSSFADWARVFDFGTGTDNYMFLAPQPAGQPGRMRLAIRTPSMGEQIINSSAAIPLNTWVHIAVTLDGMIGRLYLDGALVGTNSAMTLNPSDLGSTTQNYLGRSQWPDPYFDGAIDDFRIYARALEAAELYALAHPPAEAPETIAATPGDGEVVLTWELANGATSYDVKGSPTSGGPYITLVNGLAGTTFTDTGLSNGKTYYYVVNGNNSRGSSPNSAEVSATPTTARIHLKFDETSGSVAADASGRGQHAETVGNPSWQLGRIANALHLDAAASQYVNLPPAIVQGLTDFTIMAWVKLDNVTTYSRIFDFGTETTPTATDGAYMFLTPAADNRIRFAITTSGYANEQRISGLAPLPTGAWTHAAVTRFGTTGRLYVNGELVGANDAMTLAPSSLGLLARAYLGRSMFAPDPYLDGAIDDFRIDTRALGQEEIAAFATAPAAPVVTALPGSSSITLNWDEVPGASSYRVAYATTSGGPYVELQAQRNPTAHIHIGLDYGTTYHYIVTALSDARQGSDSLEISATPEPPLITEAERRSVRIAFKPNEAEGPVTTVNIESSVIGHTYQLQSTDDLKSNHWLDIGDPRPGTGSTLEIPLPTDPSAPRRFYRFLIHR